MARAKPMTIMRSPTGPLQLAGVDAPVSGSTELSSPDDEPTADPLSSEPGSSSSDGTAATVNVVQSSPSLALPAASVAVTHTSWSPTESDDVSITALIVSVAASGRASAAIRPLSDEPIDVQSP